MSTEILPAETSQAVRYTPLAAPNRPKKQAKFTQDLPVRLREKYEAWVNSPDYLDLQEQIALFDVRISELAQRVNENDSIQGRRDLLDDLKEIVQMTERRESYEAVEDAVKAARKRATDLRRQDEVWSNLELAIDGQRKCKESEVKRLLNAHQVLTIQESFGLIQAVADILEEYIDDTDRRGRAVKRLYRLLERKQAR